MTMASGLILSPIHFFAKKRKGTSIMAGKPGRSGRSAKHPAPPELERVEDLIALASDAESALVDSRNALEVVINAQVRFLQTRKALLRLDAQRLQRAAGGVA